MNQEYLIQNNAEIEAIKSYKPQNVEKRMFSANNGNCWYVRFSADGDNENAAKQLSSLDEHVQTSFHVTVLESGCSAYFNKRLYPIINEFENNLRKLLYLTSAINQDEKSTANITGLEAQDFGQIFTLLFVDNAFVDKVKGDIKNRNRDYFSKADVIASIESIDENTLWDVLLGKDSVPLLRKRFNDVRTYRNDVMHSHYINWKRYRDISDLYKKINVELDEAINDIEVVESKTPSKHNFNQVLEGALRTQELIASIMDSVKQNMEQSQYLSEITTQDGALVELQKRIKDIYDSYSISPRILREIRQFEEIASELQDRYPFLFQIAEGEKDKVE